MGGFDVNDAGTITGTKLVVGNNGIEHSGDGDTKITFGTDTIGIDGGVTFVDFTETTKTILHLVQTHQILILHTKQHNNFVSIDAVLILWV